MVEDQYSRLDDGRSGHSAHGILRRDDVAYLSAADPGKLVACRFAPPYGIAGRGRVAGQHRAHPTDIENTGDIEEDSLP